MFFIFQQAGLKLIDKCRPKSCRPPPMNTGEKVDRLREIRNQYLGHCPISSITDKEFKAISGEVKAISKDLFGNIASKKIEKIIDAKITTAEYNSLTTKYIQAQQNDQMWKMTTDMRLNGMQSIDNMHIICGHWTVCLILLCPITKASQVFYNRKMCIKS